MTVARQVTALEPADRIVAIGTFDGVHRGHRAVIGETIDAGLRSTVVTFDPHPRKILGYEVELLATVPRRIELIRAMGVKDILVLDFTPELARLEPEEFVETVLKPLGAEVVVAGEDFRFGRKRRGTVDSLREAGLDVRPIPIVEGVSSSRLRSLLKEGNVRDSAQMLGRPPEVEGIVGVGEQRGGTLGFPTANLMVEPDLLVPAFGIYAGAAGRHRAAISVGVNPHYGGVERKIEAFLLDFEGDLYGEPLRIEFWERLRDELVFESEVALVAQIAEDVERARSAEPPL